MFPLGQPQSQSTKGILQITMFYSNLTSLKPQYTRESFPLHLFKGISKLSQLWKWKALSMKLVTGDELGIFLTFTLTFQCLSQLRHWSE